MLINNFLCISVLLLLYPFFCTVEEDIVLQLNGIAYIEQNTMKLMRDEIRLATDIYRLKEPVPTILWKTPYNFNLYRDEEIYTHIYIISRMN
ncbi:MAG TPA: hypothetical protein DEQ09_05185 [Bacteroidales bacterium]|nr:hypothetical protein [Bacteroidales bacterium]